MRLRPALALAQMGLLAALLAACGRSADDKAGNAAANETIVPAGAEAEIPSATNQARPGPAPALPLPPLDELAGVKVGMTIADLRAAGFEVAKDNGPDPDNACGYARIAGLKDLFFMLDGDTVVRIDVDTPGHPTLGGVAIGMSENEALRRLGSRARVEPNPDRRRAGQYLVVHALGAPLGLIVETDGRKVVAYRIGRWNYVQQTEGCM